jgi:hypothetical protein
LSKSQHPWNSVAIHPLTEGLCGFSIQHALHVNKDSLLIISFLLFLTEVASSIGDRDKYKLPDMTIQQMHISGYNNTNQP